MINYIYEYPKFIIINEYFLSKKIFFLIKNEKKKIGDINYIFCDDQYLLNINKKFLNHDFYTDVITFNYSNNKISGDIFISIDRVVDNSIFWKQSFYCEMKRVIIHAILHMIGYDDKKIDDFVIMRKKENFYLNLFKLKK